MTCHLCGQPAVGRCYTCGRLFCEKHGKTDCSACAHGIQPGDPRQDRITTTRGGYSPPSADPWWRPKEADEYHPPACYYCQGLTRSTCRNCGRFYCADHAGRDGLCRECYRTSTVVLLVFLLVLATVVGLVIWGLLQGPV